MYYPALSGLTQCEASPSHDHADSIIDRLNQSAQCAPLAVVAHPRDLNLEQSAHERLTLLRAQRALAHQVGRVGPQEREEPGALAFFLGEMLRRIAR